MPEIFKVELEQAFSTAYLNLKVTRRRFSRASKE